MLSAVMILVTVQTPPFKFDGGGQTLFAERVSAYIAARVVYNPVSRTTGVLELPWPKGSGGQELDRDRGVPIWLKSLESATGTVAGAGDILSIKQKSLPWYRFPVLAEGREWQQEFREDADIVTAKSGMVTVTPKPDRFYLLTYLPFEGFSKHTSCHKFLVNSPLSLSAGTYSEKEFLDAIAFSVGGKLVERQDTWFIDVDLAAVREQFSNYFEDVASRAKSQLSQAKAKLEAAIVRGADDKTMKFVVTMANTTNSYQVKTGTALHKLSSEYLRLYLAESEKSVGREAFVSVPLAKKIISEHKEEHGFWVTLDSSGNVDLLVMTRDFVGIAI